MGPCATADVFVQVQPCNVHAVVRCVESIRTHLGKGAGRICIVTAALSPDIHQQLNSVGCDFLNEKEVFGFDAAAISGSPEARDRLFNQLVKWELRKFSQTPTYVVIDADRAFTQPASLWHGQQQTLFCENRFRFGYLMCFNYFFGQFPYPASPSISEVQHFDRAVIEEMILKIQAKYKMHWAQATFAILQQVAGTAFDAGQNYGHYLHIFRPGTFAVDSSSFSGCPAGAPSASPPIVRMGTLGYNGRFANQLYQYAYLRTYAAHHGLRAECPPWIGCSLFGHQTEIGNNELPIYREDKGEVDALIRFDPKQHPQNCELWGYFQESRNWAGNRDEFRELFEPLLFLKKPLDEAIHRLRGSDQTLVAIHLRRGDFIGGAVFWQAPETWYLHWLQQVWPSLKNPVLYVATDDPEKVIPHFAAYAPKSTRDLNVTVNGAEFYSDFYVLSQCDLLGISNSTFGFAAAMMNTTAKSFVRPDPVRERLVAFDPWDAPVQLRKPEPIAQPAAA